MANYGGKSEAPHQVTEPGSASKGYDTSEPGKIYPETRSGTAQEFLEGEGSMGFERNQQCKRDEYLMGDGWTGTMGQHKFQKMKGLGSYVQQ